MRGRRGRRERRCCCASSMGSRCVFRTASSFVPCRTSLLIARLLLSQGNDNTFSSFPEDLARLLELELPAVSVTAVKYPAFETRGDLKTCAAGVVDWWVPRLFPFTYFVVPFLGPFLPLCECEYIADNIQHRLQNKVIDLEVANETPSPTVDPSVCTILVGHSMGSVSNPIRQLA